MEQNRRKFLQNLSFGAGSLLINPSLHANSSVKTTETTPSVQKVNMSGFAAPKLDRVRLGIIGLGNRGPGAVERMSHIEGVDIVALGDKYADRVTKAQMILEKANLPKAKEYAGSEDAWKAMCDSKDVDLIYICTPWAWHTPMAVYAMKAGKHVAVEVPAAKTVDECWELVETSEKTQKHCMMLENCCYDFFELLTLNMARNGLFGDIVHVEGAYIHDLRDLNFSKTYYADMWRLKENAINGSLYPTHGLGPIAQCLDINRGDKMEHLVSMSTNDFQMGQIAKEKAAQDAFFAPYTNLPYRGNMNTTLIRTYKGKSIMVQHDVTSPRPYSRIHLISGTKGVASKWPSPARLAFGHSWLKEAEFKEYEAKYTPPIVKHVGEIAKKVGGHGGMDFIMDWRLIDCLRNGLPLDQDVYDAALWSVVVPLSIKSVAKRSRTVDIPDFTRGAWAVNKPVNLTLDGGGNTTVRGVK